MLHHAQATILLLLYDTRKLIYTIFRCLQIYAIHLNTLSYTKEYMIVCDSSTLILLAKSEVLDKFLEHFNFCYISETVYNESTNNKEKFDSQIIMRRIGESKIRIKKIINKKIVDEMKAVFNLGIGESEALALSIENKMTLAVDDKKAIKAAKVIGIKYITAISFIVMLIYASKIKKKEAIQMINNLITYARYSKEIIESTLKEVENYGKDSNNKN